MSQLKRVLATCGLAALLLGPASGATAQSSVNIPQLDGSGGSLSSQQPMLCIQYVIALQGIFPSRS